MLGIGDKFPEFAGTAVVSNDMADAFVDLTSETNKGKWQVIFLWPKDFTSILISPPSLSDTG